MDDSNRIELAAFPSRPSTVLESLRAAARRAPLMRAPGLLLPRGSVPRYPATAEAIFTGTGVITGEVSAIVSAPAAFAGAGSLSGNAIPVFVVAANFGGAGAFSVDINTEIEALFSGVATITGDVVPVFIVPTSYAGAGAIAASVAVAVDAPMPIAAAGALTANAAAVVAADMPLSGAGALTAAASSVAACDMPVTGAGTFSVVAELVLFSAGGMSKSGTYLANSGTSSAAYGVVPSWVVRTGANFTATVIEDNGIRVPSGTAVNISYRVPFESQPGPSAYTYSRLTNDGVEIPGSVVYNNGYSDASAVTVANFAGTGGIVRVEAYGNSTNTRRTVTTAAYVEIVRA